MQTQIINGTESGRHIIDGPLTIEKSSEAAPGLLRNSIDRRITKIRPMSTPIDQLSRLAGSRMANSMTVEYYSVDNRPISATVAETVVAGEGTRKTEGVYTHIIKTSDDLFFEPSETILIPSVEVFGPKGEAATPLVLYVVGRTVAGAGIEVMVVNNYKSDGSPVQIPTIPKGSEIIRMGRAATELDVQTPQFQALPQKASNNCQIFKMQVEESTLHKMAGKEVPWSFSDQEEAAIIDMRLGMEKNFLFGSRAVVYDPVKNENVYLTGGIWSQAGKSVDITFEEFDESMLISICKQAFTGSNGSKQKILIAGTDFIERLSKLQLSRVVFASNPIVKWGLQFRMITSNFGDLYVIHSEIFDQCGHSNDAMVIDPDCMTKYVHIPFHAEKLDLRRSGTRNTSAVVLTEASCVVLRFPNAHMRISVLAE